MKSSGSTAVPLSPSVAHAVAARPSVMTRANSRANKVFLLLFMCFTSIIRRYFSGAHSAK